MPKHYVIRRKLNQNQHTPQYFSTTPNPSRMKISAIQGLPRQDPRQTVKDEFDIVKIWPVGSGS
jgi:hypothetical protein